MTGVKGMHNIGRPSKKEVEKAKFRQQSFYFPLRLSSVWNEFDKISKNKIGWYPYPERCKSIILRRLLFRFILDESQNEEIKKLIINYLEEEKAMVDKHKEKIDIRFK